MCDAIFTVRVNLTTTDISENSNNSKNVPTFSPVTPSGSCMNAEDDFTVVSRRKRKSKSLRVPSPWFYSSN